MGINSILKMNEVGDPFGVDVFLPSRGERQEVAELNSQYWSIRNMSHQTHLEGTIPNKAGTRTTGCRRLVGGLSGLLVAIEWVWKDYDTQYTSGSVPSIRQGPWRHLGYKPDGHFSGGGADVRCSLPKGRGCACTKTVNGEHFQTIAGGCDLNLGEDGG